MSTAPKPAGHLFKIGKQIDLPMGKVADIAWRNMKHRFGRSIVTTSGVILATAFLMAMLIKNSMVGSMLEATRSLKSIQADQAITAVQAANMKTVIGDQLKGFTEAAAQSKAELAANQSALAQLKADVVELTKQKANFEDAGGNLKDEKTRPDYARKKNEIAQRARDVQNTQEAIKAQEEKVAIDQKVVDRATKLLAQAQPGFVFAAKGLAGAERQEVIDDVAFLQRLGKQLENELQSRAIEDQQKKSTGNGPPGGAGGAGGGAAAIPAATAEEGQIASHSPRELWLTGLALVVAGVGITNAMLMSVTERFREIGTMKCLGALDSFIMKLFLIESAVQGGMGTLLGLVIGTLLMVAYLLYNFTWNLMSTYWPWDGFWQDCLMAFAAGLVISVIGAAFPSIYASKMDPIAAMRQEI